MRSISQTHSSNPNDKIKSMQKNLNSLLKSENYGNVDVYDDDSSTYQDDKDKMLSFSVQNKKLIEDRHRSEHKKEKANHRQIF